tara:strand:+ start:127 stop:456 length:330 start_codon:yes stop_codon:yes gene_type:complete
MKDLIKKQTNMIRKESGMKLTEAKKLDQRWLDQLHKLTQRNNHTMARFQLSKWLGNDKLSLYYSAAENMNKVFGHTPPELNKLNQKMEKELYKQVKRKYANSAEIIGLL